MGGEAMKTCLQHKTLCVLAGDWIIVVGVEVRGEEANIFTIRFFISIGFVSHLYTHIYMHMYVSILYNVKHTCCMTNTFTFFHFILVLTIYMHIHM